MNDRLGSSKLHHSAMHPNVTILDGGMGRELQRMGAPFRQPEWSALALLEAPQSVAIAHQNFVDAGATVITTNTYACVPFHLGDETFSSKGFELAALASSIARRVADVNPGVSVAGSVPPVCGSYRPDFYDAKVASPLVSVLVQAMADHVDHWLIETTSSVFEAETSLGVIADIGDGIAVRPRWVSFTLRDSLTTGSNGDAVLRSGETVSSACASMKRHGVAAVLFNCSQPEVMLSAVREAAAANLGLQIGVYANAFGVMTAEAEANGSLSEIRDDLNPARYRDFAQEWIEGGASIIGGCCGISPDHIRALSGR